MRKLSSKARGKALRLKPFENNKVGFSKFKAEPSASDIAELAWAGARIKVWPAQPIEVLSPVKMAGLGSQTGLNIHTPTQISTYATIPNVRFGPTGGGSVEVVFQPFSYGITSFATYVITFNIVTSESVTFRLWGDGDTPNAGNVTVLGSRTLQLIKRNASPADTTAQLVQLSNGVWRWYSSAIKYPDIVVPPLP